MCATFPGRRLAPSRLADQFRAARAPPHAEIAETAEITEAEKDEEDEEASPKRQRREGQAHILREGALRQYCPLALRALSLNLRINN
jgi:hypothetical protein